MFATEIFHKSLMLHLMM